MRNPPARIVSLTRAALPKARSRRTSPKSRTTTHAHDVVTTARSNALLLGSPASVDKERQPEIRQALRHRTIVCPNVIRLICNDIGYASGSLRPTLFPSRTASTENSDPVAHQRCREFVLPTSFDASSVEPRRVPRHIRQVKHRVGSWEKPRPRCVCLGTHSWSSSVGQRAADNAVDAPAAMSGPFSAPTRGFYEQATIFSCISATVPTRWRQIPQPKATSTVRRRLNAVRFGARCFRLSWRWRWSGLSFLASTFMHSCFI